MSINGAWSKVKKDSEYYGPSLTRQSEAAYADINKIMAKYRKTGVLPPQTREGFYADISEVGDYREALARVEQMDEQFSSLPADLRIKFNNDPAEFLDFVSNEENMDKIEEMGLISPDIPAPEPVKKSEPIEAPEVPKAE